MPGAMVAACSALVASASRVVGMPWASRKSLASLGQRWAGGQPGEPVRLRRDGRGGG
jgi:hypothetical protein